MIDIQDGDPAFRSPKDRTTNQELKERELLEEKFAEIVEKLTRPLLLTDFSELKMGYSGITLPTGDEGSLWIKVLPKEKTIEIKLRRRDPESRVFADYSIENFQIEENSSLEDVNAITEHGSVSLLELVKKYSNGTISSLPRTTLIERGVRINRKGEVIVVKDIKTLFLFVKTSQDNWQVTQSGIDLGPVPDDTVIEGHLHPISLDFNPPEREVTDGDLITMLQVAEEKQRDIPIIIFNNVSKQLISCSFKSEFIQERAKILNRLQEANPNTQPEIFDEIREKYFNISFIPIDHPHQDDTKKQH